MKKRDASPSPQLTAAAGAPAVTPAASQRELTIDRTSQTGVAVLRTILVEAGKIDGRRITDVKLIDRCHTAFSAGGVTTTIDWSTVGNFAARDEAGHTVIEIDDGSGSHVISVPSGEQPEPLGNAAARVAGGLSVVSDTCAG